jgi:hypothetical protein
MNFLHFIHTPKRIYGRLSFIGLFFLIISLFSCKNDLFRKTEKPIAEVAGKYLYKEDIPDIFSSSISREDSIVLIENYIRNWATDILLYEKAQQNIRNDEEINRLLENYRRSLLIYEYQLQLVNERINPDISIEEMRTYYENNLPLFELKEILIKGLFLIIPNQSPDIEKFRRLANKPTDEDLDALESLSIKNAAKFEYFNERWIPLNEIQRKSPIQIKNKEVFKQKSLFEGTDNSSTFILYVEDFILDGGVQPFEYAENRIKGILLEQKKNNYLRKFESKLYEEGIKDGTIKRY